MPKTYNHLDAEVWEWCGLYRNILKSDQDKGNDEVSFRESAILMLSKEARKRVSDRDALAIELIPQMLTLIRMMAGMDRAIWDKYDKKLAESIAKECRKICIDLGTRPKKAELGQKEEEVRTTARKLNINFEKGDTDVTR